MDKRLEEAAMDLGANEWQVFLRITLPLIWPGVLSGGLLAFTLSLDEFVITFFTSGPGATTLPIQVWSMVKRGVTPEINALSTLMLLTSIAGDAICRAAKEAMMATVCLVGRPCVGHSRRGWGHRGGQFRQDEIVADFHLGGVYRP